MTQPVPGISEFFPKNTTSRDLLHAPSSSIVGVFGSVAVDALHPGSDLDVFVIDEVQGPWIHAWQSKVEAAVEIPVNVLTFTPGEWEAAESDGEPQIRTVIPQCLHRIERDRHLHAAIIPKPLTHIRLDSIEQDLGTVDRSPRVGGHQSDTPGPSRGPDQYSQRFSRANIPGSSTHESPRLPLVSTSRDAARQHRHIDTDNHIEEGPADDGYPLHEVGNLSEPVWGDSVSGITDLATQ